MRHIYVKTPNGLGKLNFYDGSLWHSHFLLWQRTYQVSQEETAD